MRHERPRGEGRVARPGLRRGAVHAAALFALVACFGACSQAKTTKYGTIPKFLPESKVPMERVVDASARKPHLAVQGNTVSVTLDAGHVLATVAGPAVPPFRAPPPPAVTATFTVSLACASGTVPIALDDFTIRDGVGRLVHPQLVTGEAMPPKTLRSGGHVAFRLTAVLPSGEGLMQWAPNNARRPLVSWDFVVEND